MKFLQKSVQLRALATFVGTIIGAGIFGVPYVMAQAGVLVGLIYFVVIGALVLMINLYYAEIVLSVKQRHRLSGMVGQILGKTGRRIGLVLDVLGSWLLIIIYIVIGGRFLFLLAAPFLGGSELIYQLFFVVLGVILVLGGLRGLAKVETALTILLIFSLVFITVLSLTQFEAASFLSVHFENWFLPYGVILISLNGTVAIPLLEDMVGDGERKKLRWVVILGMAVAVIITAGFGTAVASVSGLTTTADAVSGLAVNFGEWITMFGALVGFLAVITTFLIFLLNIRDVFKLDFKLPNRWCLAFGIVPPVAVFLLGARDFIPMLALAGGFWSGLSGVIIVVSYLVLLRRRGQLGVRATLPVIVGLVFLIGSLIQIFRLF